MGDQQAKVSDTEFGWLAGFFDGEGSVCLSIRPSAARNGGPKVQAQASMSSTDTPAFDAVVDILQRAQMAHYISWQRPAGFAKNGNLYKIAWSVKMVGHNRAGRFLEWILPALRTKLERAQLALSYIALRQGHDDPRTPITADEWGIAEDMRQLNAKSQPLKREYPLSPGRYFDHDDMSARGLKGAEKRWHEPILASTTERRAHPSVVVKVQSALM